MITKQDGEQLEKLKTLELFFLKENVLFTHQKLRMQYEVVGGK